MRLWLRYKLLLFSLFLKLSRGGGGGGVQTWTCMSKPGRFSLLQYNVCDMSIYISIHRTANVLFPALSHDQVPEQLNVVMEAHCMLAWSESVHVLDEFQGKHLAFKYFLSQISWTESTIRGMVPVSRMTQDHFNV